MTDDFKMLFFLFSFAQDGPIQNRETKRCLEVAMDENNHYKLVVQQCSGQKWNIQNLVKDRVVDWSEKKTL